MRWTVALLLILLATLPHAEAREFEEIVYLHDVGGLHLTPPVINAKVGDVVRLTVQNDGETDHNLRVCGDASGPMQACDDVWGFTPIIPPGESAVLTFEVKRAGTFDYYCAIPGHKGSAPGRVGAMWGQLVVEGEENKTPGAPLLLAAGAVAVAALLARRWRA